MLNPKNTLYLVVVFSILIATSLLLFNIFYNIQKTSTEVKLVIETQNKKRALLNVMQDVARMRSTILLRMHMEEDIFELDELNQKLGFQESRFIKAKMQLLELPLSQQEKLLLTHQGKLSGTNAALQKRVAQLYMIGEREKAYRLFIQQNLPAKDRVLAYFDQVKDIYNDNTRQLVISLHAHLAESSRNFLASGLLIVCIGIFAVILVATRLSRKEELELHNLLDQQKKISHELTTSQSKLHHYIDALSTFTALLSPQGIVELVNRKAAESTGLPIEFFVGHHLKEFHWWSYDQNVQNQIDEDVALCACGTRVAREARILVSGGQFISINFILTPIIGEDGLVEYLVAEGQDITASKLAADKLSYQAAHDALTGLINRREFERRLQELLQRSEEMKPHVILYLDLDQFKIINDTCGHVAGDELLRQIPTVIDDCIREADLLARLGGDEFGIILQYCDLNRASNIAQQIIDAIRNFQFYWDGTPFRIGVSIGIVLMNDPMDELVDTMKKVDSACFAAKDAGRNRFHIWQEKDFQLQLRRSEMDWLSRTEEALRENLLVLHAQPIVPIAQTDSTLKSFEILLRMVDEDGSLIPPNSFLPAAERYQKMAAIDLWVLENSLTLLSENPEFLAQIGYCSINISRQSLSDHDVMQFIIDHLNAHKGMANKICLEITETSAISNMSDAIHFIGILREIGVKFALDDFGSGLSSFGSLKKLPVDYLKIDGIFIKEIANDPIDRAMVKSIHEVGLLMGKQTIAEYVENEAILTTLREIGVTYAQGYAVGETRPLVEVVSNYTNPMPKH